MIVNENASVFMKLTFDNYKSTCIGSLGLNNVLIANLKLAIFSSRINFDNRKFCSVETKL